MGYKSPRNYELVGNFTASNPSDATTYYIGGYANTMNASIGVREMHIPHSGFIRSAYLYTYAVTATGTNEDWAWLIRNGTTATDYPFSTLGVATAKRIFENYALNIPVTRDDVLTLKSTTPTWVTNPEGLQGYFWLLIEYE